MDTIDVKLDVQKLIVPPDVLRFRLPFSMLISGPTLVGKSEFMLKLIKYRESLFTSKFSRIIYCYPESLSRKAQVFFQRIREEFPQAEICCGIPNISQLGLDLDDLPSFLIMDDLMYEILNSASMVELFQKHVHHFNISVCFTLQNYFALSPHGKTIMKNFLYRIIFFNRIELLELRNISIQIMPNVANFMHANFQFLQKHFPRERAYILIDGHSESKMSQMHVRTHIFPDKDGEIKPIIFYANPDRKK